MQVFKTLHKTIIVMLALVLVLSGCRTTKLANTTPSSRVPTDSEVIPHNSDDDPQITAEIITGWEFSKASNSLGWVPTHDLQLFSVNELGINKRSTGDDPYMFGPAIAIDAVNAPYVV